MTPEQLHELIRYRMEQAAESLSEAALLRDAGAHRGAVNRAYYAMFYALLALLAARELGASKHSGAIALFDREFVKTGDFSPEYSRALHRAFQRRQVSDYGEVEQPDAEMVDETFNDATRFVAAVGVYLRPLTSPTSDGGQA
jgi:uncharacterized protein (UPF0332 family)